MATITVTTNSDSGAGSLRAALASAGSGDTIVFSNIAGVFLSSPLVISHDVTINADPDETGASTFIHGQIVVAAGAHVTMERIDIESLDDEPSNAQAGTDGDAGGDGTDGLNGTTVGQSGTRGGDADNGDDGTAATGTVLNGGPALENDGTLTLDHCWVHGSSAGSFARNGGSGGSGGNGGLGGSGDYPGNGAAGGVGGDGGSGGNGLDGGDAVGGVINTGNLILRDTVISGSAVGQEGGDGGNGADGGAGGSGGLGAQGGRGGNAGSGGSGGDGGRGGSAVGGMVNTGTVTVVGAAILRDDEAFGRDGGAAGHGGMGGTGGAGIVNGQDGNDGTAGVAGAAGTTTLDYLDHGTTHGTITVGSHFYDFVDPTPANATVAGSTATTLQYAVEFVSSTVENMRVTGSVGWKVVTGAGGPKLTDFQGATSGTLSFSAFPQNTDSAATIQMLTLHLMADAATPSQESFSIQLFNPASGDILGSTSQITQIVANHPAPHVIDGTPGNDTLPGTAGDDQINGLAGNDVIDGAAGVDTMTGGTGNDIYYVDNAGDQVVEAAGGGTDIVRASVSYALAAGQEVEFLTTANNAGTGAINLTGNAFANTIYGNAGANALNGGGGADTMAALGGNDIYYVDNAGDQVFEAAGGGADLVWTSVGYTLAAGQEIEKLYALSPGGTAAINLTGNAFANTLAGTAGANVLNGGGGADVMIGLGGNDTYYVDNAGDQAIEAAGGGADLVWTSVSYALAAGQEVEKLYALAPNGTAAINLTGNAFANTLAGTAGTNVLNGGGGADMMIGGAGNDTYYVDNAADQVIEATGGGADVVRASASYVLAAGREIESLTTTNAAGTGALNLTGNAIANTLIGNAGANVLNGGGAADSMTGFGGNDTYYVDNASDHVFEAAGGGADLVWTSVSYALAAGQEVEKLYALSPGGTAAVNLTGNALSNTLAGTAGANVLNGGAGADTLIGFAGHDTFVFSTALGATNVDHVFDFAPSTAPNHDTIQLAHAVFTVLPTGALAAGAFVDLASAPETASSRILYNHTTGALSYDADGAGGAAAVQLAILDNHATLTHSDFFVA